ncbi:hypothetical protein GE278_23410 (plasmid) [Enterobacteriaceae bacterium Kacie_13]|nr:hypothetical protein GE278_23410 [Enterobacteriaceae bacterium Kacie_13]
MRYRFTLAALAAVFALTGCAKPKTADQASAFDFGSTRVTVTHIPTKTDDGTKLYVTVDGKDAGALGIGESLEVRVPEGSHKVGGYARSLIGRVTITPVDVTTSNNAISHVTYSVADLKPTFLVRAQTPIPKPKAESIPLDPIPDLPKIEMETPAAAEQTQTAPAAAPEATQQTQAPTPAAPTTTQQTQTAAPVTTPQKATETSATPKVTEVTPTTQSETTQTTPASTTPEVTELTQSPQS